jgi:hypothetical protein
LSPIHRNAVIKTGSIDTCAGAGACQNRTRVGTPVPNGDYGTLKLRRKFTNTTGGIVTRLRFRVVDITTLNSPGYAPNNGQADLRLLTSAGGTVTPSSPFVPGDVTVKGTTLETPPSQPLGGGLNSTVVVDLPQALNFGESVTVELLVGVQQNGFFRFFVNVEALTSDPTPPPAVTLKGGKAGKTQ